MRYEGWDNEDRWRWDEWLLASSEGEYAYLEYDPTAGFTIYRKVPFTPGEVDLNYTPAIPVGEGKQAMVKERAKAKVIGLDGELTWRANMGEEIMYIDASEGDTKYAVEVTLDEVELHAGQEIPEETVWEAFGNQKMVDALKSQGQSGGAYRLLARACLLFFILGFLAMCGAGTSGTSVASQTLPVSQGAETVSAPFTISNGSRLHLLSLNATQPPASNDWGTVNISLVDANEKRTFIMSKQFGLGDSSVSHLFRPNSTGVHRLAVTMDNSKVSSVQVRATIQAGLWQGTPFTCFWVISLLLAIMFWFLSKRETPPYSHLLIKTIEEGQKESEVS